MATYLRVLSQQAPTSLGADVVSFVVYLMPGEHELDLGNTLDVMQAFARFARWSPGRISVAARPVRP